MKILIERDVLRNILDLAKSIRTYSFEDSTLKRAASIMEISSDILMANPEPYTTPGFITPYRSTGD